MSTKTAYRIRNWPEYNAALRERGSLTLWVDEEARFCRNCALEGDFAMLLH
jgi:hypothetical protein